MAKAALGVVAGLVVWFAIVMLVGGAMRWSWPAYARVADAMTFTLPMMAARLGIGAVSTIAAGWITARISGSSRATVVAGALLLLFFIPDHISLWDKFPVWYHLTFLTSLVPLTFLGGRISAGAASDFA